MPTDPRDDGHRELARPVERVVVVGAGIAGLTVANALTHAGVECVVVEARDRIGGRLHTVDLGGTPVDLGGSWIHHPVGNPLQDFATSVGVVCREGDPQPELSGYDAVEQRWLSGAEVAAELALLYEGFPDAVERLRVDLGPPDGSLADAIEAYLGDAGLSPAATRRARQGLHAVIEAEAADYAERQSLQWIWHEDEYGGGYFGDLPVGGYRQVVEAMGSSLDVRLGFEVSEVAWSADGIRVTGTDGAVESGSHVVVTVPLGVLKRRRPAFRPALPPERVAAVDRLGFGRLEKVVLRFDQPFWRAAGRSHLMLFPADPAQVTVWVLDLDAFGAGPALSAFVFHSATERQSDWTDAEATEWLLGLLSAAFGRPCPTPTHVAVTAWGRDPYSGGAYTHLPPGTQPADLDLLGQPVGGRVLFAGEHTQSARVAYADGALSSGLREARRLLGRDDVTVGRW